MNKARTKVITLDSVSKYYNIYNTPQDRLKHSISNLLHKSSSANNSKFHNKYWALDSISYSIKAGDTVGIVGRNGSGKSTLLQLIAGILTPTSGSINVNGKIAALLELGAGFNPEYTGRENIYTNALILGMKQKAIDAQFDEIVEFSELGKFIDRPIKTYSSGMYIRLAFSVAINSLPEILIIDEALSVGDEAFQRKCFAKISEFQENGGTLLFVSHNPALVLELCDHAILLEQGKLILSGSPKSVINQYQKLLYTPKSDQAELVEKISCSNNDDNVSEKGVTSNYLKEDYDPSLISSSLVAYHNEAAEIKNAAIYTPSGKKVNLLVSKNEYQFKYQVVFNQDTNNAKAGTLIKTITGLELGGAAKPINNKGNVIKAGSIADICFNFHCNLTSGTYFFNAGISKVDGGDEYFISRYIDILMFKVLPIENTITTGTVDFLISPKINLHS